MSIDVWPNLDWSKAIRTPRSVLLEQAEILKSKSKGALVLTVRTSSHPKGDRFPEGFFRYDASILSLRLSYTMSLLVVEHSVAKPYPAIVIEAGESLGKDVDSEEHFMEELRDILSKQRWVDSIDRLIAMGNSQ